MKYIYTIPAIPPSTNEFIGKDNRWEYQTIKKQWAFLVRAFCKPVPQKPIDLVIVKIKYYFPNHIRRDPDNYSGKMINDGLVRAGIIIDDSFDHISLLTSGGYDKDNPRTEIIIEVIA